MTAETTESSDLLPLINIVIRPEINLLCTDDIKQTNQSY